ncbi:MAG TPA: adenosylcobinamide-GDP ribazoletransferase [Longimicrobiaceae bacterium]|jgi:adenosylcobinamide-GDP ribazoletransferase|nr:adenosylcobinamide-GDP ribazoletransferase [Longimicrobiaceae bacterium]
MHQISTGADAARVRSAAPSQRTREQLLRPLALAAAALTTVPVRLHAPADADEVRSSLVAYPVVGLAMGIAPALALLLPLPPLARAALALCAWVAASGTAGLRGFSACCATAFARRRSPYASAASARLRMLNVLRSREMGIGGMLAAGLLLGAKWAALASAPAVAPLVAAPLARWLMVYALGTYPAPGDASSSGDSAVPVWGATAVAMGILLYLTSVAASPLGIAVAVCSGTLAALAAAGFLARRFGGLAPAAAFAIVEIAEVAVLIAFLLPTPR